MQQGTQGPTVLKWWLRSLGAHSYVHGHRLQVAGWLSAPTTSPTIPGITSAHGAEDRGRQEGNETEGGVRKQWWERAASSTSPPIAAKA